ncbi:MAG TPA: GNAT family N-acetyltransferase [Clostridia bacterium]|nr:GNAT family N-acetyltransferase [Clostridia bacterium]
MFNYKTLENVDIEIIHQAFINAFSDYQVQIDLPLWKLKQMLQRRGYIPDKSMGAFNGEVLVGFILNGFREWNGKLTAYDTGTGVVPEYRKQGITTKMFHNVLDQLKCEGAEQYLLEVLQQNISAYQLYRKQGFEISRTFSCFKLDKSKYQSQKTFAVEHLEGFTTDDWEQLKEFWDIQPAWQNSIESICALKNAFVYSVVRTDSKIVGYGIIDKRTGDIPQISVDRNYRRKGIARSIMTDLINNTESDKAAVLNLDDRSKVSKDFLSTLGFECYVEQYEMILEINA